MQLLDVVASSPEPRPATTPHVANVEPDTTAVGTSAHLAGRYLKAAAAPRPDSCSYVFLN